MKSKGKIHKLCPLLPNASNNFKQYTVHTRIIQDEIPVQENNQGGVNITSAVTKYQGRNVDHYLKILRLTKLCGSALFWADLRQN